MGHVAKRRAPRVLDKHAEEQGIHPQHPATMSTAERGLECPTAATRGELSRVGSVPPGHVEVSPKRAPPRYVGQATARTGGRLAHTTTRWVGELARGAPSRSHPSDCLSGPRAVEDPARRSVATGRTPARTGRQEHHRSRRQAESDESSPQGARPYRQRERPGANAGPSPSHSPVAASVTEHVLGKRASPLTSGGALYIIPPMSGIPPGMPPPSFSGGSATMASVVRMFLAIDAAF